MKKILFMLILLSLNRLTAQSTPPSIDPPVGEYPVTINSKLSSSCEVVQPATLIEYKRYDAFIVAGARDEIYSPVLSKADFIEVSKAVPKRAVKSAKSSGFEVHVERAKTTGSAGTPSANGTNCPNLQEAISELIRRWDERRLELQQRIHTIGPDVSRPSLLQQALAQDAANHATQSSAAPKVKKQGTVILATAVGIDGKVQGVKVVKTLDTLFDQKAIEAVRKWQFSPARMRGLPVPVEMDVEVNFRLQ